MNFICYTFLVIQEVTINGALRLKTLMASNGVIYVIDKVLVPESERDIVQVLENKGGFSTLLTALKTTGLTDTLKSRKPTSSSLLKLSNLLCFGSQLDR